MTTSQDGANESPAGRATTSGKAAVETLQRLINKGNAKRLRVERDGKTVLDVPLTVGVVGALLAPHVAGLSAVVALVTGCSLKVEPPSSPPEQLRELETVQP